MNLLASPKKLARNLRHDPLLIQIPDDTYEAIPRRQGTGQPRGVGHSPLPPQHEVIHGIQSPRLTLTVGESIFDRRPWNISTRRHDAAAMMIDQTLGLCPGLALRKPPVHVTSPGRTRIRPPTHLCLKIFFPEIVVNQYALLHLLVPTLASQPVVDVEITMTKRQRFPRQPDDSFDKPLLIHTGQRVHLGFFTRT